jgi:GMP synthase (glutamine-hydrolysing)
VPSSVLVVQHSADDPVGRLGGWLQECGCELVVVRCHLGDRLPASLSGVDGLVVLGGAMGAYDDATTPWLTATKALLAEAVRADLPTLAICLGHQLLAVAAGGTVSVAPAPQVGVLELRPTPAATIDVLFGPLAGQTPPARAVHFNHDIVSSAPAGAVPLSTTDAGLQAYRLGDNVWGVQFHPEVDLATVAGWAAEEVSAGEVGREQAERALVDLAAAELQLERTWRSFGHRFGRWLQQPRGSSGT